MTDNTPNQEDAVKCSAEEAKVVAESKETPATQNVSVMVTGFSLFATTLK